MACNRCGDDHVRNGRRTCNAHRRDGRPCTQYPVGGCELGLVCKMHGDLAPRYRAKKSYQREYVRIERMLLREVRRYVTQNPRRR